jgi:DNA modification methylase
MCVSRYKGAHFATFPEELPRNCILAATRPGDVVMDVFAGSGTTGKVAMELRRRSVLLDINYSGEDGYEELARQRFQKYLDLDAPRAQQPLVPESRQQQVQELCPSDLR